MHMFSERCVVQYSKIFDDNSGTDVLTRFQVIRSAEDECMMNNVKQYEE